MRHGDAEPAAAGRGDEERQLSERGRREVLLAAQVLARARIVPQAILTSPLIRARQTGGILADALAVGAEAVEALRPGCRLGVLQALLEQRGVEGVLLVGHEPDFSAMVGELIGGGQVRMQTGAVARVDASSLASGEGTLVWLLTPAMAAVGADSGT
jgi:phosphohistidine phosphatase